MAKAKKARLTKGERLIREALASQGRPLPGAPEEKAWLKAKRAAERATPIDPHDLIRKLEQIHAATIQVSGGGFESFDELNDTLKDAYLIMLSDLAAEALDVARQYIANPGGRA
jgi:hypothetical protein